MYGNSAALAYKNNQSIGASPVKTVALLYDKAIDSLHVACKAIDTNDINLRYKANKKAYDIIIHLCAALDFEQGGEIAENLERLYSFMMLRLMQVDLRNDKTAALEVAGLLKPLRDSWHELAEQVETKSEAVSDARRQQVKHTGYGTGGQQVVENRAEAAEIVV